jgi:hypothetical protein
MVNRGSVIENNVKLEHEEEDDLYQLLEVPQDIQSEDEFEPTTGNFFNLKNGVDISSSGRIRGRVHARSRYICM